MEKMYYIDTLKRTIRTLTFFNTEDILINYKINISQLEEVGKIGRDKLFKIKKYKHNGFITKQGKKYYGDFLIVNKDGHNFTSSISSVIELYHNITFFAQPVLELARAIKKEGYQLTDKINIMVSGRKMTLFLPMLFRSFKFYPTCIQSEILDLLQKYKNNLLNIDEIFKEIFLVIANYYMKEQELGDNNQKVEQNLKVSGL